MSPANLGQTYKAVSRVTAVNRHFICGPARQRAIVHARAVAAKVMRSRGMTWQQIGEEMNRSHSSVIELVQSREHDRTFKRDVSRVSETINAQKREGVSA